MFIRIAAVTAVPDPWLVHAGRELMVEFGYAMRTVALYPRTPSRAADESAMSTPTRSSPRRDAVRARRDRRSKLLAQIADL